MIGQIMLRLAILVAVALVQSSCVNVNGLKEGVAAINNAVEQLTKESAAWRKTLEGLEGKLAHDAQTTLAVEVQQLIDGGIGAAGAEGRCDADFIGQRMKEGLLRMLAKIQNETPDPPMQYFCSVSPQLIDLSIAPERTKQLAFYGFNLDPGQMRVLIRDSSNQSRPAPMGAVAAPTPYLLTVNVSATNGVQFLPGDVQLVFVIKGSPEHQVNIVGKSRVFGVATDPPVNLDIGGGPLGSPYSDSCPTGSVAVGFDSTYGTAVDSAGLVCAPLISDGTLGSPSSLPLRGHIVSLRGSPRCPTGQVLVGVAGTQLPGEFMGSIIGLCGDLHNVAQLTGSPEVRLETIGNANGGFHNASPVEQSCPPGTAVTGIFGTAGKMLNHLNLQCRRIVSSVAQALSAPTAPCVGTAAPATSTPHS